MKIAKILLVLLVLSITATFSRKVIFANRHNHIANMDKVHHGTIIVVPGEKKKCKASRVADRTGNCRRIVKL